MRKVDAFLNYMGKQVGSKGSDVIPDNATEEERNKRDGNIVRKYIMKGGMGSGRKALASTDLNQERRKNAARLANRKPESFSANKISIKRNSYTSRNPFKR